MRSIRLVMLLVVLGSFGEARAQACPGASGWVFDDVATSDPFCP